MSTTDEPSANAELLTRSSAATTPDESSAAVEHRFHDYVGSRIPWYVRLIWLLFWIFVVYYTIQYMFPAMQVELFQKP